jgi:hypothetical protein
MALFLLLFLWVGTMKNRTHPMEGDADSGPSPLTDFRSAGAQQTLNIGPWDIRSYRILENGV